MVDADPVALLQRLIRFDTSNPPGRERECVMFIDALLRESGIATAIVARDPERPNLVARIAGEGSAPALMLQGHADVVPAVGTWTHPPFEGHIADGFVWGRGALDMKGGLAMMIAAFLRARREGPRPRGDVVLAVVSDEENGGDYGARYLVENHPGLLDGVRHAIGEFGGFTFELGGQRFFPIQVAEKRACRLRVRVRGAGGHGSLVHRGATMARLARALQRLDGRLPVRVTEPARLMFTAIADALAWPQSAAIRGLLRPRLTDMLLNRLGERGRLFDALLHNTAAATVVAAGSSPNVAPEEGTIEIDGRTVPGSTAADLAAELRALLGGDADIEITREEPGADLLDMALFPVLAEVLRAADPTAVPIPYLLPAVTDGRYFVRLGIQTYGFTPMRLPAGFNFAGAIHAADERIPVDAVEFGAEAIYRVLCRM